MSSGPYISIRVVNDVIFSDFTKNAHLKDVTL